MFVCAVEVEQLQADLAAGRIACPDRGEPLARWGFGRERPVRMLRAVRPLRPRRAVCRPCRAFRAQTPATAPLPSRHPQLVARRRGPLLAQPACLRRTSASTPESWPWRLAPPPSHVGRRLNRPIRRNSHSGPAKRTSVVTSGRITDTRTHGRSVRTGPTSQFPARPSSPTVCMLADSWPPARWR
jgi:hypothetical protein